MIDETQLDKRYADMKDEYPRSELLAMFIRSNPENESEFIAQLYEDLHAVVAIVENMADKLRDDDEEKIRDILVALMVGKGYDASAETKIRGHADILVKNKKLALAWIAEAKKFHGGYEPLVDGMKQLHDRYSNGRHQDVAFIVFLLEKDALNTEKIWKDRLVSDDVCHIQGPAEPVSGRKHTFLTKHKHEGSGNILRTRHVLVLLRYEPTDKSARASKARKKVKATRKAA